jgi:hypothetical protein
MSSLQTTNFVDHLLSVLHPPPFRLDSLNMELRRQTIPDAESDIILPAYIHVPASIAHLVPTEAEDGKRKRRVSRFPLFTAKSRELAKLRASGVWKKGNLDEQVEQMEDWFPDVRPTKVRGVAVFVSDRSNADEWESARVQTITTMSFSTQKT